MNEQSPNQITAQDNETLGISDAAKLLRMNETTLYRKAKSGEIPGAKPGRSWVFIKSDLMTYIRSLYKIPPRAHVCVSEKSQSRIPQNTEHSRHAEFYRQGRVN